MDDNQFNLIGQMFEYNLWANMQLIEVCGGLVGEQFEFELTGVYGKVQPTIAHIVRAEGGYLNRMTGSRPWADDLDWDTMPISKLLEYAQRSGQQLIAIADKVNPTVRHDVEYRGNPYHFYNWTVLLQALYHGIEHRTQIKILLTQLGVEHPELDAWHYME